MLSKTRLIISDNLWFRKPYVAARYAMGGLQTLAYTLLTCYYQDATVSINIDTILITNTNIFIQDKP